MKNKYEQSESRVIAVVAWLVLFAVIGFISLVTGLVLLINKCI